MACSVSAGLAAGVDLRSFATIRPFSSTTPAATLVPPTSTPIARVTVLSRGGRPPPERGGTIGPPSCCRTLLEGGFPRWRASQGGRAFSGGRAFRGGPRFRGGRRFGRAGVRAGRCGAGEVSRAGGAAWRRGAAVWGALSRRPFGGSILILGLYDLLEGGEGVLGHRGQGTAGPGQAGYQAAGRAQPGRAGRLADRAPLALRRLLGWRARWWPCPTRHDGRTPLLADRPADLVGNLVGHAARARAHQPALEVSDRVVAPASLAARRLNGPVRPG